MSLQGREAGDASHDEVAENEVIQETSRILFLYLEQQFEKLFATLNPKNFTTDDKIDRI